jgi:hypothetical protein
VDYAFLRAFFFLLTGESPTVGQFSDFSLPIVYLVWICVVALYPPCRWFAAIKQRCAAQLPFDWSRVPRASLAGTASHRVRKTLIGVD